ncbi:MAG: DNA repair protein RecO [bacterium]|nr:DNA repair protein RecO [bacterium]
MKEGFVKSEGVVIKKSRYRETSALIEIFSPVMGRHTLIARGMYRNKRSFSSHLEPLSVNSIEFLYREGRQMHTLTKAELIFYPENIIKDLEAFDYAAKSLKILRRQEYQTESVEKLFFVLKEELQRLDSKESSRRAYHDFLSSYLYLEGHLSEMSVEEREEGYFILKKIRRLESLLKEFNA